MKNKISDTMNQRLKDAVRYVRGRFFGSSLEVYWDRKTDTPSNYNIPNYEWDGDMASMKDLRKWMKDNPPDGRKICIYANANGDNEYTYVVYDC